MYSPKVSVVIPAYNEEKYIDACLSALSGQTMKPFEVIVVDNNSTDNTQRVLSGHSSVAVISEHTQGVTAARTAGFNAARGDIIARIDADTVVAPTWLERVCVELADERVAAVTGPVDFYDVKGSFFLRKLLSNFYFRLNKHLCGVHPLFGSNMAIRRQSWVKARKKVNPSDAIWEDLDLAIALHRQHATVRYCRDLGASVSFRSARTSPRAMIAYMIRWPRTYKRQRHWRGMIGAFVGLGALAPFGPIASAIARLTGFDR